MAYRKRKYRRRSGGSSLYSKIARTMRTVARRRKQSRLARYGARMKQMLRKANISPGQSFVGNLEPIATKFHTPWASRRYFNAAYNRDEILARAALPGANIWGRGAYSLGKAWRATVGKQAGRQIRATLLKGAVTGISGSGLYSGRGAYTESNGLFEGGRESTVVNGMGDETQSIIISSRDYLQDVYGAPSSAFTVEAWQINPGLFDNFPALAQHAVNYEEYELLQCVFEYKSTVDISATNNTNGATGTLIMATNYNPAAPNFTSKEAMMQYHGAQSCRVVDHMIHGIECDPAKNAGAPQKFVRTQPVIQYQDIKTFDVGKFQMAQVNLPSSFQNQQIGELYVTYTVKLTKPRLFSALGSAIPECRWYAGGSLGGTSISAVRPCGTPAVTASMQQNPIPILFNNDTDNLLKFTFPDFLTGRFEIQVNLEIGGMAGAIVSSIAATGSVSLVNDMLAVQNGSGTAPSYMNVVQNTSFATITIHVDVAPIVAGSDNTFSITTALTGVTSSANNSAQIIVRQINPSLATGSSSDVPLYVNSNNQVVSVP